ncbi:sulfatase-like hydrolase/transferase [Cellulophaga baltica]|uniref:sulfatase-like hydrolase/transferase n=1 Tax=Cellulophaga TaxID=104264 RepID=UPI001C07D4A7|nr:MULTISPECIES: sulfatase-like hydrolase/transferase [Cellulophaga]MBU2997990.1 sulfatase-like hydrolase/transferase [Cellulophaga baltica]MDO6769391.1 sulfatase-like hydrolase/transferase [Cellulophaga sp. 1_MG-2023]
MLKKFNILLVSFFVTNVFTSCVAQKQDKPNIIIIMADDMGYGDLSCYGSTLISTPNLDKMASEGIKFTDFHSNGPVCSPTRAAILTGKYQQRVGIDGVVTAKHHRDKGLETSEKTFAEAIKEAGYVTGMFGKWHVGYKTEFNPINQGFDEYIGYVSGNVDYHSHIDQEGYEDWWNGDEIKNEKGYSTDLITEHSVDFIKRHKDEPFLLYIPHEAPHGPFQGRLSKAEREIGWKNGAKQKDKMSEEELNNIYKEMVEVMDEGVGVVMKTLKELKLDKNTLVFFCSDNGASRKVGSNGGLRGFKSTLFEGGHRVSAMAWYPETILPNQVNNETILTMDLFPTIMDFVGAEKTKNLDGVSLKNNLVKGYHLSQRDLYWGYAGRTALREGDWKLILRNKETEPLLFNLKDDIQEKNNLASEHPDMVKTMVAKIEAWNKDVKKSVAN